MTTRILSKAICSSLYALLFLFTACRKTDKAPDSIPDNHVNITFTSSSIALSLVDSATVTLHKIGNSTQYFLRLQKSNNLLSFPLETLSTGEWTASLIIYTHYKKSQHGDDVRVYKQQKTFTLPLSGSVVNIDAPTGVFTDTWRPFIFFRDQRDNISVTVPIDAADPYFDVVVGDSKWNFFHIQRTTYLRIPGGGGNEQRTHGDWLCTAGCYTNQNAIVNTTAFIPFTQQAALKTWDNGEVLVQIKDENGGVVKDYFAIYDK